MKKYKDTMMTTICSKCRHLFLIDVESFLKQHQDGSVMCAACTNSSIVIPLKIEGAMTDLEIIKRCLNHGTCMDQIDLFSIGTAAERMAVEIKERKNSMEQSLAICNRYIEKLEKDNTRLKQIEAQKDKVLSENIDLFQKKDKVLSENIDLFQKNDELKNAIARLKAEIEQTKNIAYDFEIGYDEAQKEIDRLKAELASIPEVVECPACKEHYFVWIKRIVTMEFLHTTVQIYLRTQRKNRKRGKE